MNFNTEILNKKSLDEIRKIFLSIPRTVDQIEFSGYFNPQNKLESNRIARSFNYLPKHIRAIVFHGRYIYTFNMILGESEQNIGSFMLGYILSLPEWITDISLNFSEPHPTRCSTLAHECLKLIFKSLPSNVTNLYLVDDVSMLYYLKLAVGSIPDSIISFGIKNANLGRKSSQIIPKHIIYGLNKNLAKINISHNKLDEMPTEDFLDLPRYLPSNLKSIGLGFNDLYVKHPYVLKNFFNNLPQQLIEVLLNGNNLSNLSVDYLRVIFPYLPTSVQYVDLGENSFLFMTTDALTSVLSSLKSVVTSLRLCELNTTALSIEDICAKFSQCLPSNVDTLSFARSKFLGRSIADFAIILSGLSECIKAIDLSENELSNQSDEDLILLFSHIGSHIQKVKLNRNGFCNKTPDSLSAILSSLPKNIEIELAENGFKSLPYTYANQLMNILPDTLVHFGNSQLRPKGSDALIAIPSHALRPSGLFGAQKNIRHQSEFSFLQLTLMQLTRSKRFGADIIGLLMTFIFHCKPHDVKRMTRQIEATGSLVSAKDAPMTLVSQGESREAVKYRIRTLAPGEMTLNLSRCGLNRLDANKLTEIFKTLPQWVTSLQLRGNGFQNNEETKASFAAALSELSEKISCIDLSENGFEKLDAAELKVLFMNFPKTVLLVSLSNEISISPAEQIARRIIPKYYLKLTKDAPSLMEQARILLNDYSKGDSAFKRFITGHWGRTHAKDVVKLGYLINNGIITNMDDLLAEIEGMKFKNAAGCLSKLSMFLIKNTTTQESQQQDCILAENLIILDVGDEKIYQA